MAAKGPLSGGLGGGRPLASKASYLLINAVICLLLLKVPRDDNVVSTINIHVEYNFFHLCESECIESLTRSVSLQSQRDFGRTSLYTQ